MQRFIQRLLLGMLLLAGGRLLAEVKSFPLAGGNVLLERADATAGVFFRAFRPNRATGRWDVDLVVTNGSTKPLTLPMVLRFDTADRVAPGILGAATDGDGKLFLDLTAQAGGSELAPGASLPGFTIALGDGQTRPDLRAALFSAAGVIPPTLALVRTLTTDALPLDEVVATEIGPAAPRSFTSARGGWLTLEAGEGLRGWSFQRFGSGPVIRSAAELTLGVVTELPSVRLAPTVAGTVSLWPTDALPLPSGWSPVLLRRGTAGASAIPANPLRRLAVLARWDDAALAWRAERAIAADNSQPIPLEFAAEGFLALLVPDAVPVAPRLPNDGELIGGVISTVEPGTLRAVGRINPVTSPASRNAAAVTAAATVEFSSPAGPVSSGLRFFCEVTQEYRLRDGSRRQLPSYTMHLTGYRPLEGPSDGPVVAGFPVRPFQLLAGEELEEAIIRVEVLAPAAFAGGVLDATGGLLADGPLRVAAAAEDFTRAETAVLRRLAPPDLTGLVPDGLELVQVFELSVANPQTGKRLTLQTDPVTPNRNFVLARAVFDEGRHGFQPVERMVSDAAGVLSSREPAAGERLPGVDGGGQYWLFQTTAANALVSGVVRDRAGQTAAGVVVRTGPWTAFTDASGRYQLAAPAGTTELTLLDPRTDDSGSATVTVTADLAAVTANADTASRGPRVLAVSPTDGAVNVPRVSSVTLTFSRALNPATLLGDAVKLTAPDGSTIPSSLTLNLARTTITLLPPAQLPANAALKVTLAPTVADTSGLPLEGQREFTFTTESDVLRRDDVQLVSHEPVNGAAALIGGAGLAEPESPVILVNETTGFTATILSKPDGSFSNSIPADVNDELRAVLVNRNGTRNTLRVGRQEFADGSVGLFEGGGTVATEVEGRTVNLQVESGAVAGRTLFKVEPIAAAVVNDLARVFPPSEGKFVTPGIMLSVAGDRLRGSLDLEFPITRAELEAGGLKPGDDPTNSVFALVAVVPTGDTVGYVIIDKMVYENGKLVTHSPPYPSMESVFHALRDKNLEVQQFIRENGENIAHLINLTQAGRDLVRALAAGGGAGITSAGTVGVSFFAGALAQSLALLPLQMANASVPLTLQGRVREVEFERRPDGTVANVGEPKPLGGAMVRADDISSGSLLGGRPGRIQPGALFAISRSDGFYTILRAGARGAFQDLDFAVSATHPRYFGVTAREMANARIFGLLSKTDLAFFREVGTSFAPPSLSVSHAPTAPEPDDLVEVEIVATAPGQPNNPVRPEVEVSIARLEAIAGSPEPRQADVQLESVRSEDAGVQSRRLVFRLRSSAKGEVVLRVAGYVPFGDRALTEYHIRFGSPVIRPEEPPAPDLVDLRGPRVLRHEPAQDTKAWPVEGVIRLEFNEAMSRTLTNHPTLIRLVPDAGEPVITLAGNGRELSLAYPALQPGEAYRLILPASVAIDASPSGNLLDQLPETAARESFELRFQAAPQPRGPLAGLEQGGGAVVCGAYAYVLERGGPLDGAVVAYDLSDPAAPRKVGELSVPGFPRDLALIRNYSFQVRPNEPPRTADLLAVAGGKIGKTFTREGEDLGGFQYLWIIDLSEPTKPRRLAATVLSTTGSATVGRVKWSPPYLTALISDADFQQLDVVKLQSFIFGLNLTDAEFATMPFLFTGGQDVNGDGDYVDFALGETLPLPGRKRGDYAGREFLLAPDAELEARWQDHDWNSRNATLGVVTFEGKDRDGSTIAGAYQTVFRGGQALDPAAATFVFRADRPRRVTLLSQVPIPTPQGLRVGDVALLTMVSPQGQGWLATLDITEPQSPRLVASNGVPTGLGQPQSVAFLADGRLALGTSTHLLVLDPTRVAEATPVGGQWPALLGAIPNFGATGKTFGLDPSGLAANASGGGSVGGLSAPQLFFVRQPGGDAPLSPAALRALARSNLGAAGDFLNSLQSVADLAPTRLRAVQGEVESGVFPPQRAGQYQVLAFAPGSAGETIPLLLETLNPAGHPVADKGRGFPPVRALAAETLALIGGAPDCTVPIRPLLAHRVSDNPASSLYNTYLSVPFVLLYESILPEEIAALRTAAEPREAYWSGAGARVGFDRALPVGNVLRPFAASLEVRSLRAGVNATARSFAADYLMGPNPPPVTDGAMIPGSFGSVSAHNGEFRLEATDLVLPAPRLPIRFERVCGAQDLYDGPFGRGWDFFYNQRLVELRGQFFAPGSGLPLVLRSGARSEIARRRDLLLHTGRGRTLLYRYAGDSAPSEISEDPLFNALGWNQSAVDFYLPPEGVFDFLVRFRDGRFARLEPDGTQVWYNPGGQLEELRDRYPDNRLLLEYDEVGALVRILDRSAAVPRFLKLGYYRLDGQGDTSFPNERTIVPAESGKVCRLRDYAGRELRFFYNACGELDRREGPEVSFAHEEGFTGKPVTTYINSDSTQTPGANGLRGLASGGDSGEQLFSVTAPAQAGVPVANAGSGAGMTGELGVTLNHANTAQAVDAGTGSTTSKLPGGAETKQEFDADGRLKVTTYSGPGADPATETYEYRAGLLRKHTFPEGNSVTFDYFDDHPVLRSRGNVRSVTHDPGPRGTAGPARVQASYPTFSRLYNFPVEETTDLGGHTIRLTPTADGRDIALIDHGSDGQTERRYNDYGQVAFERDSQGVSRRYEFDGETQFLKALIEGPDDAQSNLRTEFSYGLPAGRVDFNPGTLGLPTKITPPKAGTEPVLLDYDEREQIITTKRGDARLERRSYDRNGHPVRVATRVNDQRDRVLRQKHAQNGFLLEQTLLDAEVDGQGNQPLTTTFEPDALFHVRRITHPGNRVIEYEEFDHLGRPKRMKLGGYQEEYAYDLHGNVLAVTRGGATDSFQYDGFDRMKLQSVAVGEKSETTEFTYFPRNEARTRVLKDADGVVDRDVTWDIDALGRPTLETTKADSGNRQRQWRYLELETAETELATGEIQRRKMDRAGRSRELSDSTRTITQTLDRNSNLERVDSNEGLLQFRSDFGFDGLDQLRTAADLGGPVMRQEFRADGLVERVFDALDQRTDFGLSVLGESLRITRPNGIEFRYGFDEGRRPAAARDRRDLGHTARYDAEFRQSESTLRDGAVTLNSEFDNRNQKPRRSNGSGVQSGREFDAQGRLRSREIAFLGDLRRETFTHDALDRIKTATFPSGSWSFRYDLLGPLKGATLNVLSHDYVVEHTLRADGAVTRLNYPAPDSLSVDLGRDSAGRLRTVIPLGPAPVVSGSSYSGAAQVGSLLLGGTNLLEQRTVFDARGRMVGRRYVRLADGAALTDVRYQRDPVNNITVRQEMHRAGRAEVFLYDSGNRLLAAHYGVRAPVAEETGRAGYVPFDPPAAAPATLKPGYFSRGYQYDLDGLDLLLRVSEVNPDALPTLPFGREFGGHDEFLLPQVVDGTQRGHDSLGNVVRTQLQVWEPGAVAPTPVFATLHYNGLSQLIRLERDDGISLGYDYDHAGQMFQRVLRDARLPGGVRQTVLVWDEGRLLAEYDRTGGANQLLARYHYFNDDVPLAMDRREADGQLHRLYFLTDALGHVVALADAEARVVTRYAYDAWGQFRPEAPDTTPPAMARITATADGLQLEFSETILPADAAPEFPGLQTAVRSFGEVAEIRLDGVRVDGSWRYVESVAGRPFGSVLQFASARPLVGNVEVRLNAGVAMDDWNNHNLAGSVSFPVAAGAAQGTVLATPATDNPGLATAQLSPFLFQGQYFDPAAGLFYLRTRFYDPASGSFLQRDPEAYTDSPNSYAGLAHNPTTMRDPSGRGILPPSGPRPPAASPAVKGGSRAVPLGGSPNLSRTPGASRTPTAVAPTTSRSAGGGTPPPGGPAKPPGSPRVDAATEARVRSTLHDSSEDHIQSVMRTLRDNPEMEFINSGAGWDVFRVRGTDRALRVARDDNMQIQDGHLFPDTASRMLNERNATEFSNTVRGHVAYDAMGFLGFRGASLKGRVNLGTRTAELGRPTIEMQFVRNASEFEPTAFAPHSGEVRQFRSFMQDVARFSSGYDDFQALIQQTGGVGRIVPVDPPGISHSNFMRGLRGLRNDGRINDVEFDTYTTLPFQIR